MQRGQSESVSRGQPSGGFIFWWLFRSGLSDHFGVNDSFWSDLVQPIKNLPRSICADRHDLLEVLDWFMHNQ